ncbi:hypothetical protein N9E20_01960 [Crocinitomicaceae bacterium]|nr:hypothetical protein [Crocinitomicaceae bacterium]
MRTAVIDLGTNTFNILIVDIENSKFNIVHTEKKGVALGKGGIHKNIISEDAFDRGIETLHHFKCVCNQHKVDRINAFGTSALRDASNAIDFVSKVHEELGIRINIISGEKEAELIYKGVQLSYSFNNPAVIMDIGGGSTEFIFANKEGVKEMVSLDIGISRIYEKFKISNPAKPSEVKEVENWLEKTSDNYFDNKTQKTLIGASGTFETFYELIFNITFPKTQKCIELPIDLLSVKLDKIIYSTDQQRKLNEYLIPIRKKLAPIAAIKTRWVLQKLKVKQVFVSPCSLKEGAMLEESLD